MLRLKPGDPVTAFNGHGSEYDAVVASTAGSGIGLEIGVRRDVNRESPLAITLAQGVSSGDRMDYTVQKAVELGVTAIQPLATARSVVRLDAERRKKRVAHWQAVAVAACEQCGRNRVPPVRDVLRLVDWLGSPGTTDGAAWILLPAATTRPGDLEKPAGPVTLLVGPEGGFDPTEEREALSAGFRPIAFGPRVLRTETAGVAGIAALQALWGDF